MVDSNMQQSSPRTVRTTAFLRIRKAAFSLLETMVATGICGFTISAFYLATGQALHITKAAREVACGSEILQQRVEGFRKASPWSKLTDPTSFSTLVSSSAAMTSSLPGAAETYVVSDYPADGNAFTVTRTASGATSTSGAALPAAQSSVFVVATVIWTGSGRLNRTRTVRTIITQGGLSP